MSDADRDVSQPAPSGDSGAEASSSATTGRGHAVGNFGRRRRLPLIAIAVVLLLVGATVGWARYTVTTGSAQWRVELEGQRVILDVDEERILLHDQRQSLELRDRHTGDVLAAFTVEPSLSDDPGWRALEGWSGWLLVPGGVLMWSTVTGEMRMVDDTGKQQWGYDEPFVAEDAEESADVGIAVVAFDRASQSAAARSCLHSGTDDEVCVMVGLDTASGEVRWREPTGRGTWGHTRGQFSVDLGIPNQAGVVAVSEPGTIDQPANSEEPGTWRILDLADGRELGPEFTSRTPPVSVDEYTLANVDGCEFRLFHSGAEVDLGGHLPEDGYEHCEFRRPSEMSRLAALVRASSADRDDADATAFSLDLESGTSHHLAVEDTQDRVFALDRQRRLIFDSAAGAAAWSDEGDWQVFDARTGELGWSAQGSSSWRIGPETAIRGSEAPGWLRVLGGAGEDAREYRIRGHDGSSAGRLVGGTLYSSVALPDGGFLLLFGPGLVDVLYGAGPDELVLIDGNP